MLQSLVLKLMLIFGISFFAWSKGLNFIEMRKSIWLVDLYFRIYRHKLWVKASPHILKIWSKRALQFDHIWYHLTPIRPHLVREYFKHIFQVQTLDNKMIANLQSSTWRLETSKLEVWGAKSEFPKTNNIELKMILIYFKRYEISQY